MKNELQSKLIRIIIEEIESTRNIIDAYAVSISLGGNIDVKLECQCKDSVLVTHEKYTSTRINTVAYPKDWIRTQIQILIKSLELRVLQEELR